MLIPSFRTLIAWLSSEATTKAAMATPSPNDDPCRFPIVVRPATRAFLAAQSEAFGGSLAAFSGNLLDAVAAAQMESATYSQELVTTRFYTLLKDHGLSLPEAAELLREHDITASDMSTPSVLINKLNTQTLAWVADHFHVSYNWLSGTSDRLLEVRGHAWYKNQIEAARRLCETAQSNKRVKLYIVRKQGVDFDEEQSKVDEEPMMSATEFFPVLCVDHGVGTANTYTTFEVWESGRWSYERSRHHIKMVINFAFRLSLKKGIDFTLYGKSLDKDDFRTFLDGKATPAKLFKNYRSSTWHPDDYISTNKFECTKDEAEWEKIQSYSSNAYVFNEFDELLSKLKDSAL